MIAIEYARRWPKDVDRLILCSPPLYAPSAKIGRKLPVLDDLYMQAYAVARTYSIGAQAVKFLGREPKFTGLLVDDTTWPSFAKTLQASIEEQESMLHIRLLKQPIDIIYGRFDSFLIEKNKKNKNVMLHKIIAPHSITKSYAKKILSIINTTRR